MRAWWSRPSRSTPPRPAVVEPIWFEWLALFGLLLFASWLLGVRGIWGLLVSSDPTGLTIVIMLVFLGSTIWSGLRARELFHQRKLLTEALGRPGSTAAAATSGGAAPSEDTNPHRLNWAAEYWAGLHSRADTDAQAPLDVLLERTHGPHTTAWWVNGIQLKLGLLGKVIGFSVLALQIGQIQNFDPSQSQELLKSLTQGLGIALLTTMVGLVGNILLGLQLTRLDRFADQLVALAQKHGARLSAPAPEPRGAAVPVGAANAAS